VDITLLELRVWGLAPGDRYGMDVEVAAVAEAAGCGPVHLAGFSAGATVALAAALALGEAARSVLLLEPASIGDDGWDPDEAGWRARIGTLGTSAATDPAAFRDLLMAPGWPAPPARSFSGWDFRDDLLGSMMTAHVGFTSSELARIAAPILLVRGGRSASQWALMARRLTAVCHDAREHVFPALHHFAPPYREQPEELSNVLLAFWRGD
jgi:pimeloyl-ACP methyl ester carboxylesterase